MPPTSHPTSGQPSSPPCKHTVVRVVSRSDDGEFVECQACGEVFDTIEYEDMAREEALAQAGDDDDTSPARPTASRKPSKAQTRRR